MQLIDIGANLTHESFQVDLNEVLTRARAQHVSAFIITGASLPGSQAALALAQQHDDLFATAGLHPHEAQHFSRTTLAQLQELAKDPKVVALGECGLDYNRDFSPRDQQRYAFEAQLELACKLAKPVFLHERDAHDDFAKILERYKKDLVDYVVHCFTGVESQLQTYLELEAYIGITGWICDDRRGHHLHEFIQQVPADRLMIETDAPYLLPRDLKPKPKSRRNEPMHLLHICNTVARLVNKTPLQVANETTATAQHFFRLP
ncbi:MAG: TatD family hydrolase [Gammaproteobacteria bacterium]|nr:TatD family hydrolase [Gammaproteobacteria bacterium]